MNSIFFQPNVLNIFCDASITKKPDKTYIGCPGTICVRTGHGEQPKIAETAYNIFDNATNNYSEIYAILMGLQCANPYQTVNLFSDSKISIYGVREWIFGWLNNRDRNNLMCNSSGNPVSNQDVFLHIVRYIVNNNLSINFYHQFGHVNVAKANSLQDAKRGFKESNGFDISMDDVIAISNYNNYVDNMTREVLKGTIERMENSLKAMVSYVPTSKNIFKYKNLINKK
jgi:ribonuclease HI